MGVLDQRFEKNFMITSVDYVFNWARKSAIWPLTFGLACCAIEMIASTTSRFDMARFGAEVFRPSPRQADLMIVAGTVTLKMGPVLKRVGADAGSEVVHLDGSVLERGRAVQCVFGFAGRGQNRTGRCVRCGMPAAAGRAVLCAPEAAGQNRPDDASEAAYGSAPAAADGGRIQKGSDGGANTGATIRIGN